MNEKLENRLYNWKFRQACGYLKNEPDDIKNTVKALADLFEDCGWFDGKMSIIIENVVEYLIIKLKNHGKKKTSNYRT